MTPEDIDKMSETEFFNHLCDNAAVVVFSRDAEAGNARLVRLVQGTRFSYQWAGISNITTSLKALVSILYEKKPSV